MFGKAKRLQLEIDGIQKRLDEVKDGGDANVEWPITDFILESTGVLHVKWKVPLGQVMIGGDVLDFHINLQPADEGAET